MYQILFALLVPIISFAGDPSWMDEQIEKDFVYFRDKTLSLSEMEAFYEKKGHRLQLFKCTIWDGEVAIDHRYVDAVGNKERIERYRRAIALLCTEKGLPDATLLISINDGLNVWEEMPVFAMCKQDSDRILLLPDYEAIGQQYQVLKGSDIADVDFPWEGKMPKMIWRGSTAQLWTKLTEKHLPQLSRLKLCEMSALYPELIDAKYTIFAQGGEKIPYLRQFQGKRVPFEEQMGYKYHILIDGNTCAYSNSGWKLFTHSLLFKPDSPWVQWYYGAMRPYVHYVPVCKDLSDLMEKLQWAVDHDGDAEKIADNCRAFALGHFTLSDHLEYLYRVIMRYSQLHFVE